MGNDNGLLEMPSGQPQEQRPMHVRQGFVTVTSVHGCQASQPRIKATLESSSHLFLVDTGSPVSILPVELVRNDVQVCDMPISLQMAAGTSIRVHGEIPREIHMMATNDSEPTVFLQKFIVADVTTGAILGSDFLNKNNMVVSFAGPALRLKNNLFPFSCVSDRCQVVLSHDVCFSKNQKEIPVIACGRVLLIVLHLPSYSPFKDKNL